MSYSEYRYRSGDGLTLFCRCYGYGDDVAVCLPGLTRNSKDFADLAEHLAQRDRRPWRVLCPDLRGRGRSDRDPKPARYRPGIYAGDIWRLLDSLGVHRVVLIGTSLGGVLAMVMASQKPGRLRGVVLNDIGPELPPDAVMRILQYVGRVPPAANWQTAAAAAQDHYGLAFPGVPDDFWPGYVRLFWKEDADGKPAPDMDPAIGDALRRTYRIAKWVRWVHRFGVRRIGGVPIDMWEAFDAVVMPCLLLQGVLSDVLTAEQVGRMRARKPDLQFVQVPERGHAPLLNEPEARAAIDAFLARLP